MKQHGYIMVSLFFAIVFFEILKRRTMQLRPFIALNLPQHVLADHSYAFPSGHTTLVFTLATATYFFNKKLAYFLYASGLIIGLARIAGGVHYPSDIVGGIILGILIGFIVYKLWKRYFSHKTQVL
jgi:undecaprenyl-diphosphatase